MANKIQDRRYASLVLAIAIFRINKQNSVDNDCDKTVIDDILDSKEISRGIRVYTINRKRVLYDTQLVKTFIGRLTAHDINTYDLTRSFNTFLGFETPKEFIKDVNALIDLLIERGESDV